MCIMYRTNEQFLYSGANFLSRLNSENKTPFCAMKDGIEHVAHFTFRCGLSDGGADKEENFLEFFFSWAGGGKG